MQALLIAEPRARAFIQVVESAYGHPQCSVDIVRIFVSGIERDNLLLYFQKPQILRQCPIFVKCCCCCLRSRASGESETGAPTCLRRDPVELVTLRKRSIDFL